MVNEKKPLLDASGGDQAKEDATATAILRRKKKPNQLLVDDAVNDDNSVIAINSNTMDTLELFRGDTVLVKGKKRKDTVLIVLIDDELVIYLMFFWNHILLNHTDLLEKVIILS